MIRSMPFTNWIRKTWARGGCGGHVVFALFLVFIASPFYLIWLPFDLLIGMFRSGLIGKRLDAMTPPAILDGYPFSTRPYAVNLIKGTDNKPDKVEYLADSEALANVLNDVTRLLHGQYGDEFSGTLCFIRPVNEPYPRKAPEQNVVSMELAPPLKSGKPAKFPMTVHFSATTPTMNRPIAESSVSGTLKYARDSSLGSADIRTSHGFVYETARYRMVSGNLMLTKLVRYANGRVITLYERS